MAGFTGDFQSFNPNFSFMEMDSNIELMKQFEELNPSFLENNSLNFNGALGISGDNFLAQQQSEFAVNLAYDLPSLYHGDCSNMLPVSQNVASGEEFHHGSKKRKAMAVSESSSGISSAPVSETGLGGNNKIKKKNSIEKGKRVRSNEKAMEKPKEVIHVRARRGQATDSHSLAERGRREKINERLRCLQDLVPGCYKTMGMAVMLDEIINYVQSLQNQVEFLSMKLSAASLFHDFNSEMEAIETIQGTNACEAQDAERLVREGYGGLTYFHPTWPL